MRVAQGWSGARWRGVAGLACLAWTCVACVEPAPRSTSLQLSACRLDGLGVEAAGCIYCGDGAYGELAGAQAVGMTSYLIADPTVDPEESLTPDREEWDGASVADLRELLAFLPGLG